MAVMTLLYIMKSMVFSMYSTHILDGSGHNSYQGHMNDSEEFWRVLGHPIGITLSKKESQPTVTVSQCKVNLWSIDFWLFF